MTAEHDLQSIARELRAIRRALERMAPPPEKPEKPEKTRRVWVL